MTAELDSALTHYAAVLLRDLGSDVAARPGAGAAGGFGAALAAFLGARFRPGIGIVLDAMNFEARAHGADWVLTGEGRLDRQTLSGKTISGLLSRCRALGIPVLAFAGSVEQDAVGEFQRQGLVAAVPMVAGPVTLEIALAEPSRVLEDTVARTLAALSQVFAPGDEIAGLRVPKPLGG